MSLVNDILCVCVRARATVRYIFSLPEMLSYDKVSKNMKTIHLFSVCVCVFCVCVSADEYKSELGQQLSLIAGSLVGGVCIVSLVAIAIICTR